MVRGLIRRSRDLHIRFAGPHQVQHGSKARLLYTLSDSSECPTKMIENDRNRRAGKNTRNGVNHRRFCVDLNMPIPGLYALNCGLDLLTGGSRICYTGLIEIESNAPNAGTGHFVQRGIRRFLADDGNAARAVTDFANGVDRASIVSSVNARLDNNHSIDMQSFV